MARASILVPIFCLIIVFPVAAAGEARSVGPLVTPKPGQLTPMTAVFWALVTGPSESDCPLVLDPRRLYRPTRGSFSFRLFADTDGNLAGAQLVSELFVASGRSAADLSSMVRETSGELLRQAE